MNGFRFQTLSDESDSAFKPDSCPPTMDTCLDSVMPSMATPELSLADPDAFDSDLADTASSIWNFDDYMTPDEGKSGLLSDLEHIVCYADTFVSSDPHFNPSLEVDTIQQCPNVTADTIGLSSSTYPEWEGSDAQGPYFASDSARNRALPDADILQTDSTTDPALTRGFQSYLIKTGHVGFLNESELQSQSRYDSTLLPLPEHGSSGYAATIEPTADFESTSGAGLSHTTAKNALYGTSGYNTRYRSPYPLPAFSPYGDAEWEQELAYYAAERAQSTMGNFTPLADTHFGTMQPDMHQPDQAATSLSHTASRQSYRNFRVNTSSIVDNPAVESALSYPTVSTSGMRTPADTFSYSSPQAHAIPPSNGSTYGLNGNDLYASHHVDSLGAGSDGSLARNSTSRHNASATRKHPARRTEKEEAKKSNTKSAPRKNKTGSGVCNTSNGKIQKSVQNPFTRHGNLRKKRPTNAATNFLKDSPHKSALLPTGKITEYEILVYVPNSMLERPVGARIMQGPWTTRTVGDLVTECRGLNITVQRRQNRYTKHFTKIGIHYTKTAENQIPDFLPTKSDFPRVIPDDNGSSLMDRRKDYYYDYELWELARGVILHPDVRNSGELTTCILWAMMTGDATCRISDIPIIISEINAGRQTNPWTQIRFTQHGKLMANVTFDYEVDHDALAALPSLAPYYQ